MNPRDNYFNGLVMKLADAAEAHEAAVEARDYTRKQAEELRLKHISMVEHSHACEESADEAWTKYIDARVALTSFIINGESSADRD